MTREVVLAAIMNMNNRQRAMNNRQNFVPKPVSIDTLMLVLKISTAELLPVIEELQSYGDIVFHPSTSNNPQKLAGAVSLASLDI